MLRRLRSIIDDAPDAALIEQLRRGDGDALGALIRRYGGRVRRYVAQVLRDGSWADDLTQEVFVRVFERFDSYDEEFPFSVWLFRIARNLALDLMRREVRRGEVGDPPPTEAVEPSPLGVLEEREFAVAFRAALDSLPETFRSVFVLRESEGLSYEEIAQVLDTSPKTVSSRLSRARHQLKAALSRFLEP